MEREKRNLFWFWSVWNEDQSDRFSSSGPTTVAFMAQGLFGPGVKNLMYRSFFFCFFFWTGFWQKRKCIPCRRKEKREREMFYIRKKRESRGEKSLASLMKMKKKLTRWVYSRSRCTALVWYWHFLVKGRSLVRSFSSSCCSSGPESRERERDVLIRHISVGMLMRCTPTRCIKRETKTAERNKLFSFLNTGGEESLDLGIMMMSDGWFSIFINITG